MKAIFKQLGFDEQSIQTVLDRIKARHDKAAAMPSYMDTVSAYRKEIADLKKVVEALDAAMSALSPSVSASLCAQLPLEHCPLSHFTKGIEVMALLGDMPVSPTAGPNNPQPYPTTIVKNRFVLDVAQAYRRQTDKKPTISVDAVDDNKKGGLFAEFLLACADELGISASGLVSCAQKLIQKRAI